MDRLVHIKISQYHPYKMISASQSILERMATGTKHCSQYSIDLLWTRLYSVIPKEKNCCQYNVYLLWTHFHSLIPEEN